MSFQQPLHSISNFNSIMYRYSCLEKTAFNVAKTTLLYLVFYLCTHHVRFGYREVIQCDIQALLEPSDLRFYMEKEQEQSRELRFMFVLQSCAMSLKITSRVLQPQLNMQDLTW